MIFKLLETKSSGGCGMIVGEFETRWVEMITPENCKRFRYIRKILRKSCLSREELLNYANGKTVYGLYVGEYERYKKPTPYNKRAPMSWCYENDDTVILSIHKKWADKILSGEKTMELRKSYPKRGVK